MNKPTPESKPNHVAVEAAKGVLGFFAGKLAMFPLAIGFALVAALWSLIGFYIDHRRELQGSVQLQQAPIAAHYWRAIDPPAEFREMRDRSHLWSWYTFEATLEAIVKDGQNTPHVLRWRDPEGDRLLSFPPVSGFNRRFPRAQLEFRFSPAQVEHLKSQGNSLAYGETSRPDWRKTEWDALVSQVDDPLVQTALAWSFPAGDTTPVLVNPNNIKASVPEHLGSRTQQNLNGVLLGFTVLILGAFAFALLFQGTLLLSLGKPTRSTVLPIVLFVMAVPWWSPYLQKVIHWMSPDAHESMQEFAGGMSAKGFFAAVQTEAALSSVDEVVLRFNPAQSAYRSVLADFQWKRPAACCANPNEALDQLLKQSEGALLRLPVDQQEARLRQLIEWQQQGYVQMGLAYVRDVDRLSRDPQASASAETRELARVCLSWLTRYPRNGWSVFHERLQGEYARLLDHPDANIAQNAKSASVDAVPAP